MTIALATKRPTFAVLVADRLLAMRQSDGASLPSGDGCKIVCHPSLPLACTTAGTFHLPSDPATMKAVQHDAEWVPTTRYIEEAFRTITLDKLHAVEVRAILAGRLDPVFKVPFLTGCTIYCHIALVNRGVADAGFLTIPGGAYQPLECLPGSDPCTFPPAVADYVRESLKTAHDRAMSDPDQVTKVMVEIVREAIKREAHKGDTTIGKGINAAIITSRGVQLSQYSL